MKVSEFVAGLSVVILAASLLVYNWRVFVFVAACILWLMALFGLFDNLGKEGKDEAFD